MGFDPLDQGTTSLTGAVDSLVREILLGEEFILHLDAEVARHWRLIVVVDDAGNEIVTANNTLDGLPAVDLVAKESTDGFQGKLDTSWRVTHRSNFSQMLSLDVADTLLGFKTAGSACAKSFKTTSFRRCHFLLLFL